MCGEDGVYGHGGNRTAGIRSGTREATGAVVGYPKTIRVDHTPQGVITLYSLQGIRRNYTSRGILNFNPL